MIAAVTQLIDISVTDKILSLLIFHIWKREAAIASEFPKNIISIAKKESNFEVLVTKAIPRPTHFIINGKTPIYVKISKRGTITRTGNKAAAKKTKVFAPLST